MASADFFGTRFRQYRFPILKNRELKNRNNI